MHITARINEHADKIYENGFHQIVIDLAQEAEDLILHFSEGELDPLNIGSLCYRINIVLEVYNDDLRDEIDFLTELYGMLTEWMEQC